jgi:hypothetical protein
MVQSMLPTQFEIITQAHFMVQRFFREINESLDKRGFPRRPFNPPKKIARFSNINNH